jgi:hypothetical protein
MVKRLVATLALLMAATSARADWTRGWDTTDTVLQLAFTATTAVDWLQTVHFTQRKIGGYQHEETNPVLGRYPSRAWVNTAIPLSIVGHALVSWLLPKPYRAMWQASWIGVEAYAVGRNFGAGVSVSMPWS